MQDVQGIQGLMPRGSGQVDSTYGGEVGPPPSARPRPRPGLTIRMRMTIAYGAAVFLTGVVLIYVAYLLFRWRLNHMGADVAKPEGCQNVSKVLDKLRYDSCQSAVNRQILG